MAFVFRLAKVAKFRQQLVDKQARALAAAEREVALAEAALQRVADELASARQVPRTTGADSLQVAALMARTRWISHLEDRRAVLTEGLVAARGEASEQRELLRGAWRDLEVLKALRAKQRLAWQAEQDRRERLELDEVGQIRAERQRRSKVAS